MSRVVILRGLPGSGKSTLARHLAAMVPADDAVICSADDYFASPEGYAFDTAKLGQAHDACRELARAALRMNKRLIIIDNTNTTEKEWAPYAELATHYGAAIEFREPETEWRYDVHQCAARTTHNVPAATIERMRNRWEQTP